MMIGLFCVVVVVLFVVGVWIGEKIENRYWKKFGDSVETNLTNAERMEGE